MRAFDLHPNWPRALKDILSKASKVGSQGVLAFDLDSTLFDNRPRQARILREFAEDRGIRPLANCGPEHFESGWDLRAAMRRTGMTSEEVERWYSELKSYWQERFFTSAYCVDDVAIRGAAAFCWEVVRTGAQLCYVTGRHEGMRAGTVEAMRRAGLPLPDTHARLLMKPSLEMHDDSYKRLAHAQLEALGILLAAFDNEPTHANDYRSRFPQAVVIHLATDHSGRPVELLEGIVTVPHFDHGAA